MKYTLRDRFLRRVPARPDGSAHPFYWFGRGSQWIERHDGIYRHDPSRRGVICRLTQCFWQEITHSYSEEAIRRAKEAIGPVFMPKITLRCRLCGNTASPFKLWRPTP
jgi:cobalamin biosynthesis protein CobD/CbiB